MEWISVKDAIPNDEGSYLIGFKGGLWVPSFFRHRKWFDPTRLEIEQYPTHWMKIPKVPK